MGHDVPKSETLGKRLGATPAEEPGAAAGPLDVAGQQDLTETLLGEAGPAAEGRVRDWGLVLTAKGIPYVLRRQGQGWRLFVPGSRAAAALAEIQAYLAERDARLLPDPAAEPVRPTVWLRVLAVVGLVTGLFGLLLGGVAPLGRHVPWRELGAGDSSAMLAGQWWRAVTSLTLHADPAHLLGNAVCGALFLCLLCRETGVGLGFGLCLAAGGLGNVAKVLVQGPGLHFLGASTAVFGALGCLGGVRLVSRRGAALTGRSAPVGAAFMLLAMLGAGSEEGGAVDLAGHLFGFAAGLFLGLATGWLVDRRGLPGPAAQTVFGLWALVVPCLAWGLALGVWGGP
jgi:rhomboid protease GluP